MFFHKPQVTDDDTAKDGKVRSTFLILHCYSGQSMKTFHKLEHHTLHSSKSVSSLPQKMPRRNWNFGWSLPISKMKRGLPFATPNGVNVFAYWPVCTVVMPRCNFTTKLCVYFLFDVPKVQQISQAVCIQFFPTLTTFLCDHLHLLPPSVLVSAALISPVSWC